MKVNLVTVVGDFHASLTLVQMLKHYRSLVDRIYLVYYQTEKQGEQSQRDCDEFVEYLKKYDVLPDHMLTYVGQKYDWDQVTNLYNETTATDKKAYWIIADCDEFQYWPTEPRLVAEDCEKKSYRFVTGGFVDRIGENGEFRGIPDPNADLNSLFPLVGFFRYPLSKACPNKVVMVRGGQKVCSGQHYAIFDNGTNSWGGHHPLMNPGFKIQTHHFKWDHTVIERLRETGESGCSYSEEYSLMREEILKNDGKINIHDKRFMVERFRPELGYNSYKHWPRVCEMLDRV